MKRLKEILFLKNLHGIGKRTISNKYMDLLTADSDMLAFVSEFRRREQKYQDSEINIALSKAESDYTYLMEHPEIQVITMLDQNYPLNLHDMGNDKPNILYLKGNAKALGEKGIAVIGTRRPSAWSVKAETNLVAKTVKISSYTIISGLALGCDEIAHTIALREGRTTIAVLPSGVNVITPRSHTKLAEEILQKNGCLVSEYAPNEIASKRTFVERDAIVAALSDGVFVVQCGIKSGTMHTVEYASKYRRPTACYYQSNSILGDYSGNLWMAEHQQVRKVPNTPQLLEFFNAVRENNLSRRRNATPQMGERKEEELPLLKMLKRNDMN